MMKLDKRGTAAMEFALVALPFLLLLFSIFDLGRYAITQQSLRTMANAGARSLMINCYAGQEIAKKSPSSCAGTLSPNTANVAPWLVNDNPTLFATDTGTALLVTASDSAFTMLLPIWGTTLNAPTASTTVPY